ncbi:MAG: universal stress protein [Thermoproteota archaeon]|nr:universal stress protein [Thermoproteota archaeon]
MSEEEINIKKILVPIDGSDASLKAAKYAIKAVKCEKAQIICIHVIPTPENISEFEGKPFYSLQAYYDELGKSAKPWFEKIIETCKRMTVSEDDVTTDIVADVSSIADAIINYAANNNTDLIVMGTKGKTGLKRFLIGSVADGVVRHAHCPVLVVR